MKKYLGLGLMVAGVLLLVILKLTHFTFLNVLLWPPLLMILAGAVIHVKRMKKG